MKLLARLCDASGVSGADAEIKKLIISEIRGRADIREDGFGNLIAVTDGKKRLKKVAFFAHTDEVGFLVSGYDAGGFARFVTVGGIDTAVLPGKVVTSGKHKGVIGVTPVHLLSGEERKKLPDEKDMYIDFGFSSKKQAEELLPPGSPVCFSQSFFTQGTELFGKALDDRAGCRVLTEMIKNGTEYETTFVFTSCEETGTDGAKASAYSVAADIGVVLECTTAADSPAAESGEAVTRLGKGPVISFRDRSTAYDTAIFRLAVKTAEDNGIPWQTKTVVAGGNDATAVQSAGHGAAVAAISLPARNLHSALSCADLRDYENMMRLAPLLNSRLGLD